MAKADGTRMELVSFGSRTERIGLSIRNALARCPDQGAPRPRFVSPFLSPSSFRLRSSFFLKEKNIISRLVETLKKLVICDIIFFSRASKIWILFLNESSIWFFQLFLITIKTVHRSSIELNFQLIFNGMVNGYCKNSIFEIFILSLNNFFNFSLNLYRTKTSISNAILFNNMHFRSRSIQEISWW